MIYRAACIRKVQAVLKEEFWIIWWKYVYSTHISLGSRPNGHAFVYNVNSHPIARRESVCAIALHVLTMVVRVRELRQNDSCIGA